MVPALNKIFTDPNIQTKVLSMILLQIGKICNSLANQCQFAEIQEGVLHVIKRSFVDSGVNLDWDFVGVSQVAKSGEDSGNEEESPQHEQNSAWIMNMQSLCYNLPALAMFIDEQWFFKIIFPHLQGLLGNKNVNIKLSMVLPQTCLCFKNDDCRVKMMEMISNVCQIAIHDKDCELIKALMHDMILLFKQYSDTGEEGTGKKRDFIQITKKKTWQTQFTQSSQYFDEQLKQLVF